MVCTGDQAHHTWKDDIQQALDRDEEDVGPLEVTVQGREPGEKNSKEDSQGRVQTEKSNMTRKMQCLLHKP